jgi:hypothetical protein
MKKMIIALGLLLTLGAGSVFAGEETGTVSPRVLQSFQKDFTTATDVNWDYGKEIFRASFTLRGQKIFAYYSAEGDLMSVVRYINTMQLPFRLSNDLKDRYNKYWVSDLFEVNSNSDTKYYVTLENADSKIVLYSGNIGSWSVYNKSKKV